MEKVRNLNIEQALEGCRTIAISGHIRPDGDCVGSCTGMALYLEKNLPGVRVDVFLEDFSEALKKNLSGTQQIRFDANTDVSEYDAFICLDCESARLGEALPLFNKAHKRINIDHHATNPGTGDIVFVDPSASSACELVYLSMDKNKLDADIAKNLYIGIVTDTGVFAYSNTSQRTMEIAGALLAYGFDFSSIVREVFYEKSYLQQQIFGRALLESIRFMDGKCIVSRIDKKTMQFYQVTSKDLSGIAAELVNTEGVVCAIFMYEIKPRCYKISLRSTGEVDVARVAAKCGGGGHARAAGCTMEASFHDIVNTLALMIEEQLKEGVRV